MKLYTATVAITVEAETESQAREKIEASIGPTAEAYQIEGIDEDDDDA